MLNRLQLAMANCVVMDVTQGWQKLFITGQAKLNPNTIQSNVWAANKFITADILFLSVVL